LHIQQQTIRNFHSPEIMEMLWKGGSSTKYNTLMYYWYVTCPELLSMVLDQQNGQNPCQKQKFSECSPFRVERWN